MPIIQALHLIGPSCRLRSKRRLVEPAAALSEAPGRHAARHVTAPMSRAARAG
jgi:hypothetical protein